MNENKPPKDILANVDNVLPGRQSGIDASASKPKNKDKDLAKEERESKYGSMFRKLDLRMRRYKDSIESDLNNPLRYYANEFNKFLGKKANKQNTLDLSKIPLQKKRYMQGASDWKITKGEEDKIREAKEGFARKNNPNRIEVYNENNRDTKNDPFKGTSIEGKD